jgi:hypothetical protein
MIGGDLLSSLSDKIFKSKGSRHLLLMILLFLAFEKKNYLLDLLINLIDYSLVDLNLINRSNRTKNQGLITISLNPKPYNRYS